MRDWITYRAPRFAVDRHSVSLLPLCDSCYSGATDCGSCECAYVLYIYSYPGIYSPVAYQYYIMRYRIMRLWDGVYSTHKVYYTKYIPLLNVVSTLQYALRPYHSLAVCEDTVLHRKLGSPLRHCKLRTSLATHLHKTDK